MKIVSLASGSKGNAYCLESKGEILLIDCGICFRDLVLRLNSVGLMAESITAVIFTHSHDDHIKGAKVLNKHCPQAQFYANSMTAETIIHQQDLADDTFTCFENGQEFELGNFCIKAFPIPHDTTDPVGYLIAAEGLTYFHATDVGTPLPSIGECLSLADVATLESNHDPIMLRTSGRPIQLIERIAGPRGHLANDQAAELIRKFASRNLRKLSLAHLSQDCNAPHLALAAAKSALDLANLSEVELEILSQDAVGKVWENVL